MKTNIEQCSLFPGGEKSWWKYDEYCDICGAMILDKRTSVHSTKPDTEEADFCLECICNLRDKNISYVDAKKMYKKK